MKIIVLRHITNLIRDDGFLGNLKKMEIEDIYIYIYIVIF